MFSVDNSGKGNCMYYAYSISLMYYLRAQKNPQITQSLFAKLNLSEVQSEQLKNILNKSNTSTTVFTPKEIKGIIEPILGPAVRNLAGEATKKEFLNNPGASPVFAVAQYGLEYYFKKALAAQHSDLAQLVANDFDNRNYTEAEFFRLKDIKKTMEHFTQDATSSLVEEFHKQWDKKYQVLLKAKGVVSEADSVFFKKIILDDIIKNNTLSFLQAKNATVLNQYKAHLQTEFIWGTEETLMVLHRAIQGEKFQRDSMGNVKVVYDNELVLHLHRNGANPYYQAGEPHMIVNNKNNAHWTSTIPDSIMQAIGVKKNPCTNEAFSNKKSFKVDKPFSDSLVQTTEVKKSPCTNEVLLNRKLLEVDKALHTLEMKIGQLDQHHSKKAYEEAQHLLQRLKDIKEEYKVQVKQGVLSIEACDLVFNEKCAFEINKARPCLEQDLDWGTFLTNLLKNIANAIIKVASLGYAKNSFFALERSCSVMALEEAESQFRIKSEKSAIFTF